MRKQFSAEPKTKFIARLDFATKVNDVVVVCCEMKKAKSDLLLFFAHLKAKMIH